MKSNKLDLHENTIKEFHDDLMVYYEMARREQDKHQGTFVETVTTLSIPELVLVNEKIEDRTRINCPCTRGHMENMVRQTSRTSKEIHI